MQAALGCFGFGFESAFNVGSGLTGTFPRSQKTLQVNFPKRCVWRNIHIGIDEKTLKIRAAEFTASAVGAALMLPELEDQVSSEQAIASDVADGAFGSCRCHDRARSFSFVSLVSIHALVKGATYLKVRHSGG